MAGTGRGLGERANRQPNQTTRQWADEHTAKARRRSILTDAVEAEVIPQLLMSSRAADRAADRLDTVNSGDVAAITTLLLANDVAAASARLLALRRAGTTVAALYLDVLAPVARQLGTMWEEDLCDFGQVTVGLHQLRRWLVDYSHEFHSEADASDPGRRILLVPAPGEQHTFGLTMVTEFFRAGGWTAWSGAPTDMAGLLDIVGREWFAVIGFSVAAGLHLEALASGIRQVRQVSNNRSIGVMVGGPLFVAHPELAGQLGADATAADGRGAVEKAQALLTASFKERPVRVQRSARAR